MVPWYMQRYRIGRATSQANIHRSSSSRFRPDPPFHKMPTSAEASPSAAPATTPPSYQTSDYWEQRYASRPQEKNFEWYGNFNVMGEQLLRALAGVESPHLLHIGNGNSQLPVELWQRGFRSQIANDISPTVTAQMAERTAECEGLRWTVEDALAMPHADGTFDFVIDKGTYDAISTGGQTTVSLRRLVAEVRRVLKAGGVYVLISSVESTKMALGEPYWRAGEWEVKTLHARGNWSQCWLHCATKRELTAQQGEAG